MRRRSSKKKSKVIILIIIMVIIFLFGGYYRLTNNYLQLIRLKREISILKAENEVLRLRVAQYQTDKKIVVIASSDFTHYKPAAVAYDTDHYVIEPLLELNVTEFYSRIRERNASICGYGPIAVMMRLCRGLGANSGRLLAYSNSGDVQPMAEVVGYAGIVVGSW